MFPPQTQAFQAALEHLIEDEDDLHGLTIDAVAAISRTGHTVLSFTNGQWAILLRNDPDYDMGGLILVGKDSLMRYFSGPALPLLNALELANVLTYAEIRAEERAQLEAERRRDEEYRRSRAREQHDAWRKGLSNYRVDLPTPSIYDMDDGQWRPDRELRCEAGHGCPRPVAWIKWDPPCPICGGADCGKVFDGDYRLICDEHKKLDEKGDWGTATYDKLR